ncbi:sodium-translocating pyrophosphatase [Nakamurella multipartita]|jgi:K(+)-stimulated pyrophosphate-energized sodium pump|uniref:K(+)-insensitive pyrophosphate-energized proton pump n=1 Tax=Nakamurella multipartita (strain ATCC 700099 / DSM 44233 / CIP 104796 / JCM 9543 / NBRC 105858 / Y-104) TaxID=479431 RepID=C8X982_NAKMY|nr:sodium-translocating pyrophosphatase [Nakamurella multipartita]ACV77150.1 V-type H(+)-translocating pyrophosphatase [Nakamurella multipartita DSM 44233]
MSTSAAAAEVVITGSDQVIVIGVAVVALIALVIAFVLRAGVLAAGTGTPKMQEISAAVQEGAAAYLARQFRTLGIFVVIVFVLLFALPATTTGERIGRSIAFLFGAAFSASIGYFGMWLATRANVRVAAAANGDGGREKAMQIGFRTGGAVGLATTGLGLLGASIVVLVYVGDAPKVLEGFGFGAAMLAMFMRVGGGIFTKAADVGADLVGKVEQGIPEDDPRNAATIADNVGDNVGDCAGMAADLFESYAVTLVASLILGSAAFGTKGLVFPLIIPTIGVITAIIGIYITKAKPGEPGLVTINRSFYISAAISAGLSAVASFVYLPTNFADLGIDSVRDVSGNPALMAIISVLIGIVLAAVILWLTGYFTGTETKPTKDVAKASLTGAATVVLGGISVGFESAVYTALVIAGAVYGAFLLSTTLIVALFMIALAGCGLLTTVGVIVAMDTFGPVSDNAQGVAEMSGEVSEEGAKILTELDAVGNTTKAITKGIAIATAVLAATALFGSYSDAITGALISAGDAAGLAAGSLSSFVTSVVSPGTLVGMLLGACVVFLFSGLAINAVSRAAGAVVYEVRRQFREIPGIMEGTNKPEYGKVVDIVTRDSLRELATPGLLAVFAPIAVGFGLGVGPLAGYLAGTIATGTLMAVFLANSGGAWDNAKKIVEDGTHGGKGSPAHEATVIGDTVGDPFKDTAGPAINPLLKVMNLVALLIAPAIVALSVGDSASAGIRYGISALAVVIIVTAVVVSKRRESSLHADQPQATA